MYGVAAGRLFPDATAIHGPHVRAGTLRLFLDAPRPKSGPGDPLGCAGCVPVGCRKKMKEIGRFLGNLNGVLWRVGFYRENFSRIGFIENIIDFIIFYVIIM